MRELTKHAEKIGANALVEVRQVHEQYSARTFIGRPVNVGKLSVDGTKKKSDFQNLETTLNHAYDEVRAKEKLADIWNGILWLAVLMACGFFMYSGVWPLSAIPVIIGVIFTATTRSWLIAMPSGESDDTIR